MNRMISDIPDLAQRVEKLEKANRRLKLAGVLALALVGCLLLLGVILPKHPSGMVSAQGFILRDSNGGLRALLTMMEDGPELIFFDVNTKERVVLGMSAGGLLSKEGPFLVFKDANGNLRANLAITADGPALALADPNGKVRALLGMGVEGPRLFLRDENGKIGAILRMAAQGPRLTLSDENGKIRVMLGTTAKEPMLDLFDANGKLIFYALP